jgi:uridylate kinase
MQENIVLSVGGSLIIPNGGVNTDFLSKLNVFIRRNVSKNRRFFIVSGGGSTARHYINGGRKVIKKITNEDLDWLGIHSSRLNAHLLRTIFRDLAYPRITENYNQRIYNLREPIVIGAGWIPGWSTDYCAVMFAKNYNANILINLSDLYWVYDKDPNKYQGAKIIEKTTWDFYQTLIDDKWTPGLSAPVDPIAAKLAKEMKLTVITTKGNDFRNLQRIIDGKSFKGTVIRRFDVSPAYYDKRYYLGEKGEYRYVAPISKIKLFLLKLAALYRALYLKLQFNPKTLLDVGCGTGELVCLLRKLGVDARGVELSKDALEMSKEEVKPFLKQGDIEKIPFKSNSFDMVVSFDVLEHIERSNLQKVINETVRVAKKNILHKIYTQENWFLNCLHGEDPSHVSVFAHGFWERLFIKTKNVAVARKFFRLPSFLESIYLLKKND